MKLHATFRRKDSEVETEDCVVSKVVEIPQDRFDYFQTHLLEDTDFIIQNRDLMGYEADGTRHCILVLPEDGNDGVLVDAQGSSYARYSSFLPNARQLCALGQYQSLSDFASEMARHAEDAVEKILKNQQDGAYYLKASELPDSIDNPLFDYNLLGEMLSERPEFDTVETMMSEILVCVKPEYQVLGENGEPEIASECNEAEDETIKME